MVADDADGEDGDCQCVASIVWRSKDLGQDMCLVLCSHASDSSPPQTRRCFLPKRATMLHHVSTGTAMWSKATYFQKMGLNAIEAAATEKYLAPLLHRSGALHPPYNDGASRSIRPIFSRPVTLAKMLYNLSARSGMASRWRAVSKAVSVGTTTVTQFQKCGSLRVQVQVNQEVGKIWLVGTWQGGKMTWARLWIRDTNHNDIYDNLGECWNYYNNN